MENPITCPICGELVKPECRYECEYCHLLVCEDCIDTRDICKCDFCVEDE